MPGPVFCNDPRRPTGRILSGMADARNDVREDYRSPTTRERAILEMLLSVDMPGVEELRAQVPHVRVARWDCGCASFDIQVDRALAPKSRVTKRPAAEASHVPERAFDLLLWVHDGWLSGVEIVDYVTGHGDDSPEELPPPEEWADPT
jgi:hypothetical protein